MKRYLNFIAAVALCLIGALRAAAAEENTLVLSDITAKAGEQVVLSIGMNNTASITGFQFDLYLPDGVTVAKDESGDDAIALSTVRTNLSRHTIAPRLQADGAMRAVCTSMGNKTFTGSTGEVVTATLVLAEDFEPGTYTIRLAGMELSTPQMVKYKPAAVTCTLTVEPAGPVYGDVNGDGKVTIADVNEVVRVLLNQTTSSSSDE